MKYQLQKRQTLKTVTTAAVSLSVLTVLATTAGGYGVSSAKEITSGGGTGGTTTTCSPVASFTAKGDGKVAETGLGSVDLGYSIKPCDKAQTVTVTAEILNWNTKEVVYQDTNALMTGKISIFVPNRTLYQARVTVYDATTGAVLGSQSTVVSTTPKGGV